jgi:hypothetical protein
LGGLEMFVHAKHHEELQRVITGISQELRGLLLLRIDAHRLWDNARFCFEPIETDDPDPKVLGLEFLWLSGDMSPKSTLSFEPPVIADHTITDPTTGTTIESGDHFILETDNPDLHPLPSAPLLKLQAHLHKALRACAGAGVLQLIFRRDTEKPKVPAGPRCLKAEGLRFSSPFLAEYLMSEATISGIIQPGDLPYWRASFDPACPDPSLPL